MTVCSQIRIKREKKVLNFSKTFDAKIIHNKSRYFVVYFKLYSLGPIARNFFENYLGFRSQHVMIGGFQLELSYLSSSVLRVQYWLHYFRFPHLIVRLVHSPDFLVICRRMLMIVSCLFFNINDLPYSVFHCLQLNPNKSYFMLFRRAKSSTTALTEMNVVLVNISDVGLHFEEHINESIRKAFCKFETLYPTHHILSTNAKTLLCDLFILSQF